MHDRTRRVLLFLSLLVFIGHSLTLISHGHGHSAKALAAAGGFQSCSATDPVSVDSGDNDGFQENPFDACADGPGFALDVDSGSSTSMACRDLGKDRQLFYNYGLAIPAGSVVDGIEVRLDGWFDGGVGALARMCIELSWDGGTTWTAPKMTALLTTAETTYILGSPGDSWGRVWQDTDLLDFNFRVRVTNLATDINQDFSLDWAAVQVRYTAELPEPTATLSPAPRPSATLSPAPIPTTAASPPLGVADVPPPAPIPTATVTPSSTGTLTTTATSTPTPTPTPVTPAWRTTPRPTPTRKPAAKGLVASPISGIDPALGTALIVVLLCFAALVALYVTNYT